MQNIFSSALSPLCLLLIVLSTACSTDTNESTSSSLLLNEHDLASDDETAAQCNDSDELLLHVDSPDWRNQVIYFLMIDRFNDGDPTNNDQGAGEYDPQRDGYWSGGDIDGIIEKLDYIQSLGATAIWITPPVANQWISRQADFSGYHGYWATHFKQLDKHYGTLQDYRRLSHELHCRGMYLIQDIVANHTGFFFGYKGEYDPEDTAKNFVWYTKDDPVQAAPKMQPFNKVDRHNPEHAAAGIYNWTPEFTDHANPEQSHTYQLSGLADINTHNPEVVNAFKDAYSYWVEEVGVDGFRVDTVKYVDHEFWHHLFHDQDGIFAKAKSLNKKHFLSFGEVLVDSDNYENNGEKKVVSYLGTEDKPELNSVIGFPLYFDIDKTFSGGQPTSLLAYRLQQFMEIYPNPYVVPNFVDNHDTKRFLFAGSRAALKQALSLVFTIPGIPTVYQGTEQSHIHARQAMFAGGFQGGDGWFDDQSEFYLFIQKLADLRKENSALMLGNMVQLESEASSQGILAYKREHQQEQLLVLFNSADHSILVRDLDAGFTSHTELEVVFAEGVFEENLMTGSDGYVSLELPARAILILKPAESEKITSPSLIVQKEIVFSFDQSLDNQVFTQDIVLTGTVSEPAVDLKLILNGNLDRAHRFKSDDQGNWQVGVPVRNLGEKQNNLLIYAPEFNSASEKLLYKSRIVEPELTGHVMDGLDDANGPTGQYSAPNHENSKGQREMEFVSYSAGGANLELTLKMKEITDAWVPTNGFDNVGFSIFVNFPNRAGSVDLPLLNAKMADQQDWDVAHIAYGWGNYIYSSDGSTAMKQGDKLGISPEISVNKADGSIRFSYEGELFGLENWSGTQLYITTWDLTGEGAYRDIMEENSGWAFGGGHKDSPKIMDDMLLVIGDTN